MNLQTILTFHLCFQWANCELNKTLNILHLTTWDVHYDTESILDFTTTLVNRRLDMFPGIHLEYKTLYADHEDVGEAVKAFIDGVAQAPIKCAIFGPMYSSQAEIVAETASFYNLVEMGYSTSSPLLSDTNKYPFFARSYDSSANNNLAILKLLEHFGWKKIGAIAYDVVFVASTKDDLMRKIPERNISVVVSTTYTHDPLTQMQQIKDSNARIIITYGRWDSESLGTKSRLMCQAYKLGMYGRRYQWFDWDSLYGVMRELEADPSDGCTTAQLWQVTDGMFTFEPKTISDWDYYNTVGATGKTAYELEQDYQRFLRENAAIYSYLPLDTYLIPGIVDGAWALYLAMNQTEADLNTNGSSLVEFTYDRLDHAHMLYRNLISLQFFGQSGDISFDEQGDKLTELHIYQIRRGQLHLVGEYNPLGDELRWLVDKRSLFRGRDPPLDSDVIIFSQVGVNRSLELIVRIIAVLGICYSVAGCAFTFYFRNTRYIKMSSPRINYLIAVGCMLTYIAAILWGADCQDRIVQERICKARVWLLTCGFTFAFGSMFSKTWRVHKVVTTKTLEKKIIKDAQLVIIVVCMLLIDFTILLLWQYIDDISWKRVLLDMEEDVDQDGIIYQPYVLVCSSDFSHYMSGTLYIIKGLSLMFGSFFAWQTRKVEIEGLNDSKHIGVSVYNIMIASLLTVPLVNILPAEHSNIVYGITVVSMLVCATLTVTLVFGTKMYTRLAHGSKVDAVGITAFEAAPKTMLQVSSVQQ